MSDTVQLLQGKNEVFFVRLLKNASTESAMLIPYLTSNSVNQSRSTTNTETKSGVVHAVGSLTTTMSANFEDAISKVGDEIREAITQAAKIEVWEVRLDRVKSGQNWALYAQGYVTQDNSTNSPNSISTRAVTFTIQGQPREGWTTVPSNSQQEINYVFKGLGSGDEGKAWTDGDAGTGSDDGASAVSKV